MDKFEDFMAEQMRNPEFVRALDEARARHARSIQVRCHFGHCVHDYDPVEGKIHGGVGPLLCPCDHLPGWKSARLEGQARPAVPAKARGRHGSRILRSRKRHALPNYSSLGEWLPAA